MESNSTRALVVESGGTRWSLMSGCTLLGTLRTSWGSARPLCSDPHLGRAHALPTGRVLPVEADAGRRR